MTGPRNNRKKTPEKGPFMIKPRERKEEKNMDNLDEMDEQTIDFNQLVYREYQKLHREYRGMEDDRHAIAGKGKSLKSKRERLVQLFERDRADLEADVNNATAAVWERKDEETKGKILELMEHWEDGKLELKSYLAKIYELDNNISKIIKKMVQQKLKIQAIYGKAPSVAFMNKRKQILENRLYLVTTKHDTKMSENRQLKYEMDMLLKNRQVCSRTLDRLQNQINVIRGKILECVQKASAAYDARDESTKRINSLRDKEERELKLHMTDVVEYERQLKYDKWQHKFSVHKGEHRIVKETEEQRNERKLTEKYIELGKLLVSYAKTFRKVLRSTNRANMEELTNHYNQFEQRNFAKFVNLTNQNYEMTSLLEDVTQLRDEFEDLVYQKQEEKSDMEDQIRQYDSEMESKRKEIEETRKEVEDITNTFQKTLSGIGVLFRIAGCDFAGIQMLLGSNEEKITAKNAVLCMKSVELAIEEMLAKKAEYELRKNLDAAGKIKQQASKIVQGPKEGVHRSQGGPFVPFLIITGQLENTEEDDAKIKSTPCTYAELKDEVAEKLRLQQEALAIFQTEPVTISLGASDTSIRPSIMTVDTNMQRTASLAALEKRRVTEGRASRTSIWKPNSLVQQSNGEDNEEQTTTREGGSNTQGSSRQNL